MTGTSRKKKNLLIIDDDEIFQFTVKQLNKQDEVFDHIFWYSTIDDALNYLEQTKDTPQAPHVILLDIRLKHEGESGWEFLKKYDTKALKPVVQQAKLYIVSSSVDEKDRQRASRHPLVSGYLEKPLRFGNMNDL